jgi:hypothetical protein
MTIKRVTALVAADTAYDIVEQGLNRGKGPYRSRISATFLIDDIAQIVGFSGRKILPAKGRYDNDDRAIRRGSGPRREARRA